MNVESHIGQYKILRTLGAGGMGTVYLGEHILLGRRAAIKTLLPALSSHREIVDRFFNEAKAISAISDPGVVQIFDFGYHVDGTAYIVMEFLEGESLATRIDRLGKLSLIDALRITRQVAGSLGAAHTAGIVHRDLKPGNVFVVRDPEAQSGERTKILDFGICKLGDSADGTATQTGTMLGTPVYMSPEQCKGAGRVDHRSDIYSVGAALFHMLTGRPPFDCDGVGEFIAAHLKEDPPAPSELVPTLPPAVDALVMRCLAKDPLNRFQTMEQLQAAADRVLAELSDPGARLTAAPMAQTPLGEGFRSSYDVNRGNKLRTVDATPMPPSENNWFVDSLAPVAPSSISDEWETPKARRGLGKIFLLAAALFVGLVGGLAATNYALDQKATKKATAAPAAAASEQPVTNETPARQAGRSATDDTATADEQQQQAAAAAATGQLVAEPMPEAGSATTVPAVAATAPAAGSGAVAATAPAAGSGAAPAPTPTATPPAPATTATTTPTPATTTPTPATTTPTTPTTTQVERTKVARPPRPRNTRPEPRRHVPENAPQQTDDSEDLYDAR